MSKKTILICSKLRKAGELIQSNRLDEAMALLEQIKRSGTRNPDVWFLSGTVHGKQGSYLKAVDCFRQSMSLRPNDPQIAYNLGLALKDAGDFEDALAAFRKVARLQPDHLEIRSCLAQIYVGLGRLDEAIKELQSALRQQPNIASLHANLGSALQAKGLLGQAEASYQKALQLAPGLGVYDSYGSAMIARGDFDKAMAIFTEGLCRQPDNNRLHSNFLMTLNYIPEHDPQDVFREHQRWGLTQRQAASENARHGNDRKEGRRLRIGYVSPDFRANHSVTYYIEPLIAGHDRGGYEVYCYSIMPRPDETTRRLQQLADHWRDIHGLTDRQFAEQIVRDQIDILVDLAGHTANNSLAVFARKPAPVQVTYLGYPNTTGLPAMDYRLTDAIADPAGEDGFYTEELVRLPGCFLCYQPPGDAPSVTGLPATGTGYITFGSFNNLAKINTRVVELWSRVLEAAPDSRLLVKNRSLNDPETRARYARLFESSGIDAERVELCGHVEFLSGHLALYGRVDIALDTFPYNGTTTTCEALWMGVPVITLTGETHAGRVGKSLLECTGLGEWVAGTADGYVSIAREAARDIQRLAELRAGLREYVAASRLCDRVGFVRAAERAYLWMWDRWCRSRQ